MGDGKGRKAKNANNKAARKKHKEWNLIGRKAISKPRLEK